MSELTEADNDRLDEAIDIVHRSKAEADEIVAQITFLANRLHAMAIESGHAAGIIKGEVYGGRP